MAIEYDYFENTNGHEWRKDEDGEVDIFAFEVGHHNGPVCVKCGFFFCHHCEGEVVTKHCPLQDAYPFINEEREG